MKLAHKTITNSIASFLGIAFTPLAAFFITPYALTQLGNVQYGIYAIFFSVLSLLNFLDFGLAYASIRSIVESNEKKEFDKVRTIINMTISIFIGLTIVIIFIGILLIDPVMNLLNIPSEYTVEAQRGFIITLLSLGAFFIVSSYRAVLQAYQRYIAINVVSASLTVIFTIVTLISLWINPRLDIIIFVTFINNTVNVILFAFIVKRIVPSYYFHFAFDKTIFKQIFHFSSYTFIIMMCYETLFQFDKFLINRRLGPTQLTYYVIPMNITLRMREAIANINNVLFPLATELHTNQRKSELINLYQQATKVNMIGLAAMAVPLFVYSDKIIGLWLGDTYVENSSILLKLGVIGYSLYTLTSIPASFLGAMNLQKNNMLFFLSFTITNVILLFILVPTYGLIGAGLAFIFAHWSVPIMYLYSEKKLSAPFIIQLKMYSRLSIVILLSAMLFNTVLPFINNIWMLIGTLIVSGCLILSASALIVLNSNDRTVYSSYIKKLLGRFIPVRS